MNNFLELHSDTDYRNLNRPYYTGTWEYILVSTGYLIPFQFVSSELDNKLVIERESTAGVFTNISDVFYAGPFTATSWTKTGAGTWSSSGGQITAGTAIAADYMVSNTFSLNADTYFFAINIAAYTGSVFTFVLKKGATELKTVSTINIVDGFYIDIATAGSDYTLTITCISGGSVTANTPGWYQASIHRSGNYWWYDGGQLVSPISTGIFRLRVTCDDDVFYSDWCEVRSFTGLVKYKLTSSYDYGGVKYVDGYEQWIYKDTTVRRSPKASIEITADQKNGVRIDEKKVSAVRYNVKFKVTESEYAAFVHSMGGEITITDETGKVYDCTSVEMTDPTFYRSNGILEISFIDANNISVWTRNNSDL